MARLVLENPLVTLTGAGGIGKTALAVAVDQIVDRHAHETDLATSREALQVNGESTFRLVQVRLAQTGGQEHRRDAP